MDDKLINFLLLANSRGYGSADVNEERLSNGEHIIRFSDELFEFKDIYYGGEPYAGQAVIFEQAGQAVWAMQYRGKVYSDFLDEIYGFLGKVLTNTQLGLPRGVDGYREGEFLYEFHMDGELDDWTAEEKIFMDTKIVYSANFFGGLVDTRNRL